MVDPIAAQPMRRHENTLVCCTPYSVLATCLGTRGDNRPHHIKGVPVLAGGLSMQSAFRNGDTSKLSLSFPNYKTALSLYEMLCRIPGAGWSRVTEYGAATLHIYKCALWTDQSIGYFRSTRRTDGVASPCTNRSSLLRTSYMGI